MLKQFVTLTFLLLYWDQWGGILESYQYMHTLDKCWGIIQKNIIVLTAGILHTCLEDSGIVKSCLLLLHY